MAGELTVIAEFSINPENRSLFLENCAYDSERSNADEPGCLVFDVITSNEDPNTIVLVERYTDQAAFDTHLKTPHFEKFAATTKALGAVEKSVRFFTRTAP